MSIAKNLQQIEQRIHAACVKSHRNRDDVRLIAVSKFKPVSDIEEAFKAGQRIFGENRVQELQEKAEALQDAGIAWHMIGTLQTNKVKYLPDIPGLTMIHSVNSLKLAEEIDKRFSSSVDVLIEVNIGDEISKSGVSKEESLALIKEAAAMPHLNVKGLMIIPPFDESAEEARRFFKELYALREEANTLGLTKEPLTELSMGMTSDFEQAIEEGATFVRVGTAIFGSRN